MCMAVAIPTLLLTVRDWFSGATERLVSAYPVPHRHSMMLRSTYRCHKAKAGDLVFFHSTYNAGTYVTHVGIYAGNNRMYHAGDPIGYADLTSSYWQQHLIGAGRVKTK